MTHYRCCGQVYFSEAAFSEHMRQEHSLAPSDLTALPFTTFSTFTMCILAGSRAGDWVLDPFMGSGTVAKVAMRLGRKAFGAELNFRYIRDIASRRTAGVQMMALPFEEVRG